MECSTEDWGTGQGNLDTGHGMGYGSEDEDTGQAMKEGSRLPGVREEGIGNMGCTGERELLVRKGDRGMLGTGSGWGCTRPQHGCGQGLGVLVPLGVRDVVVLGWGCTSSSLTCVWDTCPHGVTCDPTAITCCHLTRRSFHPPSPLLALLGAEGCSVFGMGLRAGNSPCSGSPGWMVAHGAVTELCEGSSPEAWDLCAIPCREPAPGHARGAEAEQEEEERGHRL